MSTDLATRYASGTLDERWNYAQALSSGGDLLPQSLRNNAGKVFYAFEVGAMLGIHPVAAIQGVNVIDGKPTLSPQLMSAVVRRAGHLIRVEVSGTIADLSIAATATLVRADDPDHPFVVTWTIEKAQRAGLLEIQQGKIVSRSGRNQTPTPWEKYTESMLKARAIGEVCREGATDALMGVVYMPEELDAEVNDQGELTQMPATRRPAPQADDYRPIALVNPEVAGPTSPVIVQEASPTQEPDAVQTDMDIVELYRLADLQTYLQAQQTFLHARQNGHLDRVVEGKPFSQWLQDVGESLKAAEMQVDQQTGEVYGEGPEAA